MEQNKGEAEINLNELLALLLHKLWIIIIAILLAAAGTGAVNWFLIKPIYTSTTSIYVISKQEGNKMTYSDIQIGTQLTKDYMILVKSRPVIEEVISELDLDMTYEQLAGMIEVNTPQDTRILEIEVSHPDPLTAKQLADAIAEISKERMVSIMEMEKVNTMEPGNLPTSPASPNIVRNTIIGGILGGVIVSVIIILVYFLNDSIRTSDDIEKYLCMTTLGIIPLDEESESKKRRNKKAVLAV